MMHQAHFYLRSWWAVLSRRWLSGFLHILLVCRHFLWLYEDVRFWFWLFLELDCGSGFDRSDVNPVTSAVRACHSEGDIEMLVAHSGFDNH